MKNVKHLVLIFILMISILLPVGCYNSNLDDKIDLSESPNYNRDIKVIVNETEYNYTAKIGSELQIMKDLIPVKSGYYLKGYYDQEENGEKYLNAQGRSLTEWRDGYPSVLYAQWTSLDHYILADNQLLFEDVSESYGTEYYTYTVTGEKASAIAGNLDKDIVITLKFKIKADYPKYFSNGKIYINIQDNSGSSAESFAKGGVPISNIYEYQTIEFTCPARTFGKTTANGLPARKVYFKFNGSSYTNIYIKDFVYDVKFV